MALFSAAKGKPAKKIRGFLGLPGELRNRIYQYCFEEDFCVEVVAKGNILFKSQPKTVKLILNIIDEFVQAPQVPKKPKKQEQRTLRVSRRLGRYRRVEGLRTCWSTSLSALTLVSKQVHKETIVFLYQKATFVFDAPRRIQDFLEMVPKVGLVCITKLQLHYTTYRNPKYKKDVVWQKKHIQSWTAACRKASKRLTNLEELEVWLWLSDKAWFDLHESYIQPLLQFRRLACGEQRSLSTVKVHFNECWLRFADIEIHRAAMELHQLWGEAISKAMLGKTQKEAMGELEAAWKRHRRFHHVLGYLHTGW
jgi:hypothetical protein